MTTIFSDTAVATVDAPGTEHPSGHVADDGAPLVPVDEDALAVDPARQCALLATRAGAIA